MISEDIVEVSVTYKDRITFFLRMIGIAEEQRLRQKTFGLTDAEKAEKEYGNNVQALKDLSVKIPAGMFPKRPEDPSSADLNVYEESFAGPTDALDHFFKDRSVRKERIAYYAVHGYFIRLAPSDFF